MISTKEISALELELAKRVSQAYRETGEVKTDLDIVGRTIYIVDKYRLREGLQLSQSVKGREIKVALDTGEIYVSIKSYRARLKLWATIRHFSKGANNRFREAALKRLLY